VGEVRHYHVTVASFVPPSEARTEAFMVRAYTAEDAAFQVRTHVRTGLPSYPKDCTARIVAVAPWPRCECCQTPATCTKAIPDDDEQRFCDEHCDHPPGCERLASEVIG
jgi:hypothetical protein